ncbi:MAG: trypsin-like peptidase domain-containing protein [Planctomycetaceae bacterium]|nr:trypsin-like peptidase domain-containing protein [Planctomycetaceae bacterium]
MRVFLLLLLVVSTRALSAEEITPTDLVMATHRLEHPETSGTGFLVLRDDPDEADARQLLLVTAAHAFAGMKGETTTLVLREQDADGTWKAKPYKISIREGESPLWTQHPQEDVAVLVLDLPDDVRVDPVPIEIFPTADQWNADPPEPGSLIRCVGYPHAPIFKPNPAAFATTRLGCIADFPLTPIADHPKFLVDFNIFEGDSGGPVYRHDAEGNVKIIGLVHGQHFIDERFKNIYSEGMTRKRLGLAIIENSTVILETIDQIPDSTPAGEAATTSNTPKSKL